MNQDTLKQRLLSGRTVGRGPWRSAGFESDDASALADLSTTSDGRTQLVNFIDALPDAPTGTEDIPT